MKRHYPWTRARAVVRDGEVRMLIQTTPGGSYIVLDVAEWWRRLSGQPEPPCVFVRRGLRRTVSVSS